MLPVSIIIPHYNNPRILGPCLESLDSLSPNSPEHEIIVVDDASTDASVSWIQKEHPSIRVVQRGENGGFVKAVNAGVASTEGSILVFLNNDTWVDRDWLRHLVRPILTGQLSGACGSVLTDWEGKRALFLGGTPNLLGFGFEEQGDIPDPSAPNIPIFAACGGAMAISRDLYQEAGGFDESFGMLYEDLDLCWRLNIFGYDCHLIPSSRVGHKTHASLGRGGFSKNAKYYIGNSLRTLFKNADDMDIAKRLDLALNLARAREKACLLDSSGSPSIVDDLIQGEGWISDLAIARSDIKAAQKRTSKEIFERFVPAPTRPWFYDEDQKRLLEQAGYWDLEQELYRASGYA